MGTLLIALGAGIAFIIAYHTYGRWLGGKIFNLAADTVTPAHRLRDDVDYCPTKKPIVFGHHFTSIAGTGPIVGPAIAVMWGWLPALLWVVFGSIFIGAVHDFGALVVSLRNNGQSVGDIAGRVLNRRVRLLFLLVLAMALTIVLAIFGLVIAAVFDLYPASIFPCVVQIPIAVVIGLWLHRKGMSITIPSLIALAVMYLTVIYGDWGPLHAFNHAMGGEPGVMNDGVPIIVWVGLLLVYSYVASVLPVWTLLQPRDYINSLQLISALALIVVGLFAAAIFNGSPPANGMERPALDIAAPMMNFEPKDAPLIFPFLFITIACGAISGFHCLVSSGTSSKQLDKEPEARFVGYGGMLTEGFLATLVILACVAGLGLGSNLRLKNNAASFHNAGGEKHQLTIKEGIATVTKETDSGATEVGSQRLVMDTGVAFGDDVVVTQTADGPKAVTVGTAAFQTRYASWLSAKSLGAKVGAFVDGAANFLASLGIPLAIAVALMGVLVASFAGTTLDTACRLQRYVIQELAATLDKPDAEDTSITPAEARGNADVVPVGAGPLGLLKNKHGATIFAIVIAGALAALPIPGKDWSMDTAGGGGLILWPLFGATNQLLAGLSFLVMGFYLWRRKKPIFFLVIPLLFMLVMPALAMVWQMFIEAPGKNTSWLEDGNWLLMFIGAATLALEIWMIIEALLLWPKVKGVIEPQLPGNVATAGATEGVNC